MFFYFFLEKIYAFEQFFKYIVQNNLNLFLFVISLMTL